MHQLRQLAESSQLKRICRRQWSIVSLLGKLLFLAFIIASGSCLASESGRMAALKQLSLEELSDVRVETVVGATKHEQRLSDAPANVTVITAEEIKLYGWRTLGEALRSVSGMLVTYDRGYSYLGVRGFNSPGDYSGRVLINVDGHRMNDAFYDSAAMDTDFVLDLDLIDRIEIIRGPGSTLYGDNAFFGVINIVTRKAKAVENVEASASYGALGTYSTRVSLGHVFTNGIGLLVSGTWYDSRGNPDLFYPEYLGINNGIAHRLDQGWSHSAFGSLNWRDWTLEVGFNDRYKRLPTAQYTSPDAILVFGDSRLETIDERLFADLKYEHSFENGWELTARPYFDRYRYDGWYPYHYNPSDPLDPITVDKDWDESESVGLEIQASKQLSEKHRLIVGAESRYDFNLKVFNADLDPAFTYFDLNKSGYFTGLYGEDEYQVCSNFILNAGMRYDYYRTGGSAVSPRFAAIWHPFETDTVKFLFGQAYRAPNAFESYYNWPRPTNSPDINPETIQTYELEFEHEFNRVYSAKASLFYNELHNTISGGGNNGFTNVESATTRGAEIEASAQSPRGWRARASYTFAYAVDENSGSRLPNAPAHMLKLNVAVPVWRRSLFLSGEAQYMSERNTVNGGKLSGFGLVNAGLLGRNILPGVEFSADVYNIFDQRYSDPATSDFLQSSIEQNGRTFRLKATVSF